jgi:hypothetical protein
VPLRLRYRFRAATIFDTGLRKLGWKRHAGFALPCAACRKGGMAAIGSEAYFALVME